MTPFDLKIITPEKTFFEGNTEQIIVRTVSGDIGILAGHAPYVANIVSSPFRIKIEYRRVDRGNDRSHGRP